MIFFSVDVGHGSIYSLPFRRSTKNEECFLVGVGWPNTQVKRIISSLEISIFWTDFNATVAYIELKSLSREVGLTVVEEDDELSIEPVHGSHGAGGKL